MNKKYILTEEYKNIIVSDNQSKRVFRIMAIRSFGGVKAGQLGGFVEKEENLSHEDDCFVFDDAVVCDDAMGHRTKRFFQWSGKMGERF